MSELLVKISNDLTIDIKKSKNILVVGRTGSGKSTFLHKIINGLKNKPKEDLRLFLVDLKDTEFYKYANIKNLYKPYGPISNDWGAVIFGLYDILDEIEDRKEKFAKSKANNIDKYNELLSNEEKLPHIVIIIDEALEFFRENTEGGHVLNWLACNSTSLGVHLIISTQRANMVFPELKANLQTRVCFRVADKQDSMNVIHDKGAESLETGEFLYKSPHSYESKKLKTQTISSIAY